MNDKEIKVILQSKIELLEKTILDHPYSLEESKKAHSEFKKVNFENMTNEDIEIVNTYSSKLGFVNDMKMLKEMKDNLESKSYMHVPTRYVAIKGDEDLLSPAGFHPTERIFFQTKVSIMSNKRLTKKDLPFIEGGYRVYDLDVLLNKLSL